MTELVASPRLAELESKIERGLATFVEVGNALREIRDAERYKEVGYTAFEDYCRERWDFSRQRAHQLIDGAEVTAALSTIVDTRPANEGQARELAPLKDKPEELAAVWSEVSNGDGKPTAERIRAAVRLRLPKPKTPAAADPELCPMCGQPFPAHLQIPPDRRRSERK